MKNQRFQRSTKIFLGLVIVFFSGFWLSQNAMAKNGIPNSFAVA